MKERKNVKHILSIYKGDIKANSKGFSLVGVLIGLSLMTVVGLGVTTIIVGGSNDQKQISIKGLLGSQNKIFESHMINSEVWEKTISIYSQPPHGLECLKRNAIDANGNPVLCTHNKVVRINILDTDGGILYKSSSSTRGFTYNLEPCNSFSSGGNNLCPFRWNVSVKLTCDVTPTPTDCHRQDTRVTISGDLVHTPSDFSIFKPVSTANYSFQVLRGKGTRFFALEESMETAKQSLISLDTRMDRLTSMLTEATSRLNDVENKANTLSTDLTNADIDNRLTTLENGMPAAKTSVDSYVNQNKSCQSERDAAVNAMDVAGIIAASCSTCCPP